MNTINITELYILTWLNYVNAYFTTVWGFPGGSVGKNLPANAGDAGSIPGSGRPPGEGNGHPLQHSCLGNPMDRGAWQATAHGVTKESDTTERLNINSKVISNLKIIKVPCYEG